MKLNFLVETFAGLIVNAGASELANVLNQLNKDKPKDYKAVIAAVYAITEHLKPVVKKSKTSIDNIFIDGLEKAVEESLSTTGVVI